MFGMFTDGLALFGAFTLVQYAACAGLLAVLRWRDRHRG
jgi:hypothetical protein